MEPLHREHHRVLLRGHLGERGHLGLAPRILGTGKWANRAKHRQKPLQLNVSAFFLSPKPAEEDFEWGKKNQSVAVNHGELSPTFDYFFYTELWGERRCWEGLLSHRRCVINLGNQINCPWGCPLVGCAGGDGPHGLPAPDATPRLGCCDGHAVNPPSTNTSRSLLGNGSPMGTRPVN